MQMTPSPLGAVDGNCFLKSAGLALSGRRERIHELSDPQIFLERDTAAEQMHQYLSRKAR